MNIVTPYPTNIPINTVNVTTELARRDNQLREMITKPNPTEAGVAERGVAKEHDKQRPGQQQQNSIEVNLRHSADHQKIEERQGGQGEGDSQEQQQQQKREAEQKLAKVEKEAQRQHDTEVRQLQSRDTEVRTHEQAHSAIGGRYAGSPTYEFKRGPDGRNYAVGGEVQIDTSPIPNDPEATIAKMQQVRAAALAPAEPSGQDRKVASQASQTITDAKAEQVKQNSEAVAPSAERSEAAEVESASAERAEAASGAEESAQGAERAANNGAPVAAQAQAAPRQGGFDPFEALFGREDSAQNGAQSDGKGAIFGAAGLPGGERRDEVNANRAAAEQRNADVVARAGRIESFYARSTVPRQGGFSQFA